MQYMDDDHEENLQGKGELLPLLEILQAAAKKKKKRGIIVMDFSVIWLEYHGEFGPCDGSDTLDWEVELNEEQQKAYKKAVMTRTQLEEVEELSGLCDKAYPEIVKVELENLRQFGEEYDKEYLENILEVSLPDVYNLEAEDEDIEDYIRELKAMGDDETIKLVVEAQEEYYQSNEFDSLEDFVASL